HQWKESGSEGGAGCRRGKQGHGNSCEGNGLMFKLFPAGFVPQRNNLLVRKIGKIVAMLVEKALRWCGLITGCRSFGQPSVQQQALSVAGRGPEGLTGMSQKRAGSAFSPPRERNEDGGLTSVAEECGESVRRNCRDAQFQAIICGFFRVCTLFGNIMVVIRLARGGAKKRPFYNIVATDSRNRRDGRFIERIGFYNPVASGNAEPLRIAEDRLSYWQGVGAQLSPTVARLVSQSAKKAAA